MITQSGTRFVAIDVETADSYKHIIEIAAVEVVDGRLGNRKLFQRIRPATDRMNPFCFRVHGISLEDVALEPGFEQVLPTLIDFVGDASILAHNRAAELYSIQFECSRLQVPMPFPHDRFVCTMRMARDVGLSGKLREMCHTAGIPTRHLPQEHDALSDATMAAQLFIAIHDQGQSVSNARS